MTNIVEKIKKMEKKKKGVSAGPRSMTEQKVQKLIDALKTGQDRDSACAYAEVPRSSFYERMKAYPDFRTIIEDCEHYWITIVNNQKRKLINEGYRPAIDKELKSKRKKIYGDRIELAGDEDNPLNMKLDLNGMNPKQLDELRQKLMK